MKFVSSVVVTAILSFAFGLFLPWWSIALAAFIVNLLIPLRPGYAFISGFLSLFLLWSLTAVVISEANHHILAGRVSMLVLKTDSPVTLILITATIGAIVGGLAALSASFVHGRQWSRR